MAFGKRFRLRTFKLRSNDALNLRLFCAGLTLAQLKHLALEVNLALARHPLISRRSAQVSMIDYDLFSYTEDTP